jgi:non-ribosomal peptide synthetase component F
MSELTAPVQPRKGIGIEELRPRIVAVVDHADRETAERWIEWFRAERAKTLDFPPPRT